MVAAELSCAPEAPPLVATSIARGERQRRSSAGSQPRIAGTGCVAKCMRFSRALAAAASAGGSASAASASRPLRPRTWPERARNFPEQLLACGVQKMAALRLIAAAPCILHHQKATPSPLRRICAAELPRHARAPTEWPNMLLVRRPHAVHQQGSRRVAVTALQQLLQHVQGALLPTDSAPAALQSAASHCVVHCFVYQQKSGSHTCRLPQQRTSASAKAEWLAIR